MTPWWLVSWLVSWLVGFDGTYILFDDSPHGHQNRQVRCEMRHDLETIGAPNDGTRVVQI
jgi:hypothetical protein